MLQLENVKRCALMLLAILLTVPGLMCASPMEMYWLDYPFPDVLTNDQNPSGSAAQNGFTPWAAGTSALTRVPTPIVPYAQIVFNQVAFPSAYVNLEGATLYYTVDGSTPSRQNGQVWSNNMRVTVGGTLQLVACKDGLEDSEMVACVLTKTDDLPESPHPYTAGNVQWYWTNPGGPMAVHFDPQCSLGEGASVTIYASAVFAETGYMNMRFEGRDLAGRTLHTMGTCGAINIVLNPGKSPDWGFKITAIEKLSPGPDFFPAEQTTFNDSVQVIVEPMDRVRTDTTIVYTTDGSDPTSPQATMYQGPFFVDATTSFKAITRRAGLPDSAPRIAKFTKSQTYPHTPHPYAGNSPEAWVYRLGGAQSISMTFDTRTRLPVQARLRVLFQASAANPPVLSDVSGSPFRTDDLAGRTINIPGDTVHLFLQIDGWDEDWGFEVSDIQAGSAVSIHSSLDPAIEADKVILLVNERRAEHGCLPLRKNDALAKAAIAYAKRMADLDFFSHFDPQDGSGPSDRVQWAGYQSANVSENIAATYETPEDVVRAWLESPGHFANIMSAMEEIGVGVHHGGSLVVYWVQDFGISG